MYLREGNADILRKYVDTLRVASFTGRTYGCIVRQGSVGDALASVKNYVASRALSV